MRFELNPTGIVQAPVKPETGLHPTGNFDRYVKSFLIAGEVEGKSPGTLDNYVRQLRTFKEFLLHDRDSLNLPEISRDDIRLFLLYVKNRGVSPDTIHTYQKNLKAFFNWFVTEQLLPISPMLGMKPPRLPKRIIMPLSSEDINNMLLLCSGPSFKDFRDRAIIMMFLDTGLRLEELANICLNDMNVESGMIKVMGKGSKERYVRIGKVAQRALLRYLLRRDSDSPYLWLTVAGEHLRKGGVQTVADRLLIRAEVSSTKRGPHILRHTFAINFLRNGGDVFSLQAILGHATLEMTRRYVSSLGWQDFTKVHEKASPMDNLLK